MGLGQIMKENPLSGHFPSACTHTQVGREGAGGGKSETMLVLLPGGLKREKSA